MYTKNNDYKRVLRWKSWCMAALKAIYNRGITRSAWVGSAITSIIENTFVFLCNMTWYTSYFDSGGSAMIEYHLYWFWHSLRQSVCWRIKIRRYEKLLSPCSNYCVRKKNIRRPFFSIPFLAESRFWDRASSFRNTFALETIQTLSRRFSRWLFP